MRPDSIPSFSAPCLNLVARRYHASLLSYLLDKFCDSSVFFFFFFLMIRHPPRSPLFPSPPLFRSDRLGEVPVALVVGRGDAAAIMERTKGRLVAYKRPRRLFVVDALPHLASGKVDKPAAQRLADRKSVV